MKLSEENKLEYVKKFYERSLQVGWYFINHRQTRRARRYQAKLEFDRLLDEYSEFLKKHYKSTT